MKACPLCHITGCSHERKFINFSLAKVTLIQKSIDASLAIANVVVPFLSGGYEVNYNINSVMDELRKCQEKLNTVRRFYESKL